MEVVASRHSETDELIQATEDDVTEMMISSSTNEKVELLHEQNTNRDATYVSQPDSEKSENFFNTKKVAAKTTFSSEAEWSKHNS